MSKARCCEHCTKPAIHFMCSEHFHAAAEYIYPNESTEDKKVLAAAKRLAKNYLKYGKELSVEIETLAKAAMNRWPELKKINDE